MDDETRQEPPATEPPVPQLADVPEEEWDYSNSQAFAGCGVVGAVVLAIILPVFLRLFMDEPWSQIIGFGVPAVIAIYCAWVIYQMTKAKRLERRTAAELPETDD